MNRKRPFDITVLAWLLILVGIGGLVAHLIGPESPREKALIALVELLAVLAGAFLLRGKNWARWLALAWMAFHVAISVQSPRQELVIHSVLLVAFAVILLRRDARGYFAAAREG